MAIHGWSMDWKSCEFVTVKAISGQKTSNQAVGYFAYFKLINGFEKTLYMTIEQIQEYAKRYSKAYNNGPWKTDFDAMAKKTVLRQILKYGPMSTEMQEAEIQEIRAAQEAANAEIAENAGNVIIDMPMDPQPAPQQQMYAQPAMQNQAPPAQPAF